MSPSTALLVWSVLLLLLVRFDPARVRGASLALWLPTIELFIICSRLPSQWLGLVNVQAGAQTAFEEGNSLDRMIYIALILLSAAVLLSRSFRWAEFFRRNVALVAFLGFALVSILWSDYMFVAFKRWFRDLAHYLTILVVLTDPRPLDALRTVVRRVCYILIPISIVLIKYFPEIGRQFEIWSGAPMAVGAATSKNTLGAVCMFAALIFVWDTMTRWRDRKEPVTRNVLFVNVAFISMTLWLLVLANSATATLTVTIGLLVLTTAHLPRFRRQPRFLIIAIPAVVVAYAVLSFAFGFNLTAPVAELVGRDPTLTGRTIIWQNLLRIATNPLVGTGYDSFWMGPRLQEIWKDSGTINHAHNGYLQIYLNLGLVGLSLLVIFLLAAYRRICHQLRQQTPIAPLALTMWTVMLFYNVTEVAVPTGVLWLMILPAALSLPESVATFAVAGQRVSGWKPTHGASPGNTPVPVTSEARGVTIPVNQWLVRRLAAAKRSSAPARGRR